MPNGISEDQRALRKKTAQSLHEAAVFAKIDLASARLLPSLDPTTDFSDRISRAEESYRSAEEAARSFAVFAGVARPELDPPVRTKVRDETLPRFRTQLAEAQDMLDNSDLYLPAISSDPRFGARQSPQTGQLVGGNVESLRHYLHQCDAAVQSLTAYLDDDPAARSRKPRSNGSSSKKLAAVKTAPSPVPAPAAE